MRRYVVVIVILGLGVCGLVAFNAAGKSADAPPFRTAGVDRGMIRSTVMATGTVEPIVKVLVGSQVSGTVVRWYADFNQQVAEGEILAELDQDQIKATIAQRKADVAIARARAAEAKANYDEASLSLAHIQSAYELDSSSDYELNIAKAAEEMARASYEAAKAEILAAEAELQTAEIQLDKTIIRAPIDGVVISRDVDAGQTVAASLSAPTLFTIANDLMKMRVNAAVSETDIGQVHEGMATEFRVDAYPTRRFAGKVTQVRYAETVVDNVVTYVTMIDVDNPELLLRPGMTATIVFEVERVEDALRVPNSALRFEPTPPQEEQTTRRWSRPIQGKPIKPRVYRVSHDNLEMVELDLGITDGTYTQVNDGKLAVGDTVVIGWDLTAHSRGSLTSRLFQ